MCSSEAIPADCQLLLEDFVPGSDFGLAQRSRLLSGLSHRLRLTQSDRTELVAIAAREAGPGATAEDVNRQLGAKISHMLTPFSAEEIMATAVAFSPDRKRAILPLSEQTFYGFVSLSLSPSMKEVFLWERYRAAHPSDRFIVLHRGGYLVDRPGWTPACRDLIYRAGGWVPTPSSWRFVYGIGPDVESLVDGFEVMTVDDRPLGSPVRALTPAMLAQVRRSPVLARAA